MQTTVMTESVLVAGREPSLRETLVRLIALEGYEVGGAASAEEATARLETEMHTVVLVDLDIEGEGGDAFVHRLRERWPHLGIVLLAEQSQSERVEACVARSADDALLKSHCRTDLPIVLRRVLRVTHLRRENHRLREQMAGESSRGATRVEKNLRRLIHSRRLTLRTLVTVLGARETETRRHSQRVADYTLQLAERMGLDNRERHALYRGALLHDIGKIGIPDGILLKPGPLTEAEWAVMHSHPSKGHDILRDLSFLRHAAECALYHHERWDGAGYPTGLAEGEIPLSARIVGVADALDAMSVARPFRGPLSFDRIVEELTTNRGTQFDPEVVDAALRLYRSWDDLHPEAQSRRHTTQDRGRQQGQFSMSARQDRPRAA
jgi:putative nucleotidyltransferase with HDIG domain